MAQTTKGLICAVSFFTVIVILEAIAFQIKYDQKDPKRATIPPRRRHLLMIWLNSPKGHEDSIFDPFL